MLTMRHDILMSANDITEVLKYICCEMWAYASVFLIPPHRNTFFMKKKSDSEMMLLS